MAGRLHQVSKWGGLRAALFVWTLSASAHPSVGLVITPNGDVFYSDLERVWRVTPNGQKIVAVPDVHAHELALEDGAVLGEDSEWLGGNRYRHRIFKRAPDGRVTDVVPWTNGFWQQYGLVRDAAGARYWVDCGSDSPARRCTIRKRDRAGRVTDVVTSGRIHSLLGGKAGEVYYVEGTELRRANGTKVERVAAIGEQLMGLARDAAGNVYVAAHASREVVRIAPNGTKQVIARSTAPWAPSGVAVSPRGEVWVLEWSGTQSRVRRTR
ncbi:MAG TPA: hypothetical protein VEO54_15620 [Thermoanaerobaculia bacterium]|nr:hypothetical protein [Thermoanaerobaculia bacterium]